MANKTLSDFPVLTNLDAASVAHVQKELVDYQVTLPVLAPYLAQTAISGADEKTDPVDADMVGLMDSAAAGNALKKFSWANFKAKLKTYFDALYPSANGWVTLGLTMTYASADSPTFTATVPGDVTGVLSAGMKLKLTQTTAKYFIITAAPSYASGTGLTTLTLYGGTDYTLDDAAISNVYYSAMKAPHGFPPDPAKWTVEVTDDTTRSQEVSGTTFYNLGSISIQIPIGLWDFSYQGCFGGLKSSALVMVRTALSASASSISDSDLVSTSEGYYESMIPTERRKKLNISAKTTYYLIEQSVDGTVPTIYAWNQYSRLIIRAECAYL